MTEQLRSMRWIAGATGGRSISNRSQLGEAIFDLMRQTRFSYVLAFSVPMNELDGQFHRLQVTLKPRGLNWVARQTYFAGLDPASSPGAKEASNSSLFPRADIPLSVRVANADSGGSTLIVRVGGERAGASGIRVHWENADDGDAHSTVLPLSSVSEKATGERFGSDEMALPIPRRERGRVSAQLTVKAEDERSGRHGSLPLCRLLLQLLDSEGGL
jgi:hypothetical protein